MSKTEKLSVIDSIISALEGAGISCKESNDDIIANVNGSIVILTAVEKEYVVRFHYKSCVSIIVNAGTEEDAIRFAFDRVTDKHILDNIQQDCQPDVEDLSKAKSND